MFLWMVLCEPKFRAPIVVRTLLFGLAAGLGCSGVRAEQPAPSSASALPPPHAVAEPKPDAPEQQPAPPPAVAEDTSTPAADNGSTVASDSRRADCEAGLAEACHALGTDDAVEPDERLAFLVAACGLDHADACFAAAMQALNVGDLAKSKEHFDLGCIRGNALSCTLLGEAHFHGKQGALELPRSRSKARRYHLRAWELTQSACEHGDGGACVVVGIALTTGHTGHNEGSGVRVPKDESKGLEVWDHACLELGDADACRSIAFDLYRTGGTLSEKYRARACALGLHSLCE